MKRVSRRRDLTDAWNALVQLIPSPWSAEEFIRQVSRSRQRPIHLLTYPLSTGDPTGFWLCTPPPTTSSCRTVPPAPGGTRSSATRSRTSLSGMTRSPSTSWRSYRAGAEFLPRTGREVPAPARLPGPNRTRSRNPGHPPHRVHRRAPGDWPGNSAPNTTDFPTACDDGRSSRRSSCGSPPSAVSSHRSGDPIRPGSA